MRRRSFLQFVAAAMLAPALSGFRLPDPMEELTPSLAQYLEWAMRSAPMYLSDGLDNGTINRVSKRSYILGGLLRSKAAG